MRLNFLYQYAGLILHPDFPSENEVAGATVVDEIPDEADDDDESFVEIIEPTSSGQFGPYSKECQTNLKETSFVGRHLAVLFSTSDDEVTWYKGEVIKILNPSTRKPETLKVSFPDEPSGKGKQ